MGKSFINEFSKPYIIAEIGVNHEGSMEKAKRMVRLAKEGGANAVKFQSYKANTLASKNSPAYWNQTMEPTANQYKLFKKYDKFEESDYIDLSKFCKKVDIDFLSTPFDNNSINYLEPLVPFYKISSSDITNFPLLRNVAKKSKTVLMSTGASTLDEISYACGILKKFGCEEIILLHCVLNYPTDNKNANLRMIKGLEKSFPNFFIGYSDHTIPDKEMSALISAWLMGAVVIEKHFTFNKDLVGNDHYHAMDVNDLKKLTNSINTIHELLGETKDVTFNPEEKISRLNARRSIVMKNNVKKGQKIKEEDLISKRPGTGLSPTLWNNVIGKEVIKDLEIDELLSWEKLK